MERSELALIRARRAYARAYVLDGARGLALALALCVLAFGLHATTRASWLIAAALAASLGALGWRGGAWRRGAFAGVIAGLPPLVVSSGVAALAHGGHCADCGPATTWACTLACLGTSSLVGGVVGYRATVDASPHRYAIAAIATAALTGLLGCATMGLSGALGVVLGLIAGGVTGWVVAARPRATC